MSFKTTLRKSGGSLIVRIPPEEIKAANLEDGNIITLSIDEVKKGKKNGDKQS